MENGNCTFVSRSRNWVTGRPESNGIHIDDFIFTVPFPNPDCICISTTWRVYCMENSVGCSSHQVSHPSRRTVESPGRVTVRELSGNSRGGAKPLHRPGTGGWTCLPRCTGDRTRFPQLGIIVVDASPWLWGDRVSSKQRANRMDGGGTFSVAERVSEWAGYVLHHCVRWVPMDLANID